jgi:hypothetical protein
MESQLFILLACLHAFLHPGIANVSPLPRCQIYIKCYQQDGVPGIPIAVELPEVK